MPYGDTLGAPCVHACQVLYGDILGIPVGTHWVLYGDMLGALCGHTGGCMGTLWVLYRDILGAPWGHAGCSALARIAGPSAALAAGLNSRPTVWHEGVTRPLASRHAAQPAHGRPVPSPGAGTRGTCRGHPSRVRDSRAPGAEARLPLHTRVHVCARTHRHPTRTRSCRQHRHALPHTPHAAAPHTPPPSPHTYTWPHAGSAGPPPQAPHPVTQHHGVTGSGCAGCHHCSHAVPTCSTGCCPTAPGPSGPPMTPSRDPQTLSPALCPSGRWEPRDPPGGDSRDPLASGDTHQAGLGGPHHPKAPRDPVTSWGLHRRPLSLGSPGGPWGGPCGPSPRGTPQQQQSCAIEGSHGSAPSGQEDAWWAPHHGPPSCWGHCGPPGQPRPWGPSDGHHCHCTALGTAWHSMCPGCCEDTPGTRPHRDTPGRYSGCHGDTPGTRPCGVTLGTCPGCFGDTPGTQPCGDTLRMCAGCPGTWPWGHPGNVSWVLWGHPRDTATWGRREDVSWVLQRHRHAGTPRGHVPELQGHGHTGTPQGPSDGTHLCCRA